VFSMLPLDWLGRGDALNGFVASSTCGVVVLHSSKVPRSHRNKVYPEGKKCSTTNEVVSVDPDPIVSKIVYVSRSLGID
jgi:hypothetical protein